MRMQDSQKEPGVQQAEVRWRRQNQREGQKVHFEVQRAVRGQEEVGERAKEWREHCPG